MQDKRNMVPIGLLKPHPRQAELFSDLDPKKREEVKRSIAEQGIRDPIKVLPDYTIVAGHQRWQIAKELGMERVPVEVLNVGPEEAEYLLVADNTERRGEEKDPVKKARQAEVLRKYWGVKEGRGGDRRSNAKFAFDGNDKTCGGGKTLADVAQAIGENLRTTQNLLSLNRLIPEFQEMVSAGRLPQSAGYELAALPEESQREIYDGLTNLKVDGLTVAEAKELKRQLREQEELLAKRQKELAELKAQAEEMDRQSEEYRKLLEKIRQAEEENRRLKAERPQVIEKVVRRVVPGPDPEIREKIAALEKEIAALEAEIARRPEKQVAVQEKQQLEWEVERMKASKAFLDTARRMFGPLMVGERRFVDLAYRADPAYLTYFEVGRWLDLLRRYQDCLEAILADIDPAGDAAKKRGVKPRKVH